MLGIGFVKKGRTEMYFEFYPEPVRIVNPPEYLSIFVNML